MKKTSIASLIIIISVLIASIAGFSLRNTITLQGVEVRQYEGTNLSSITDFRENSIRGPQYVNLTTYSLEVSGLVRNPRSYSYAEVIEDHQNYRKVTTLNCVEGWSATILWEGILVKDIINEVGALPSAKVVIFHAYDGYTTSFPIEYILNSNIIMADKMNNLTLPPERGFPFQLVAESKWGYKWIKWITWIELSNDTNYRGYWESRGYSNNGNLNQSFNVG